MGRERHPGPGSLLPGVLVVAAAALWGTTGTAQALGPDTAPTLGVAAWRIVLAGACLLALAALRPAGRAGLVAFWRRARLTVITGALAVAAYQVCFFAAVRSTGVAIGTLVAIGSAPVIAGLLGLAFAEPPGRTWLLATLLVLAGGALLLLAGDGGGSVQPLGVVLALGAGASYAGYTTLARRALLASDRPDVVVASFFAGGGLVLVPVAAVEPVDWLAVPAGTGAIAWLALGATVLPYLLWAHGLRHTPVARATTLGLAEPLTATLLGVFLLREQLTGPAVAGMALIGAGLLAALWPSARTG